MPQCDEQRPGCVRCAASNVECPGYFQETKFLDEGVGLRRKFHYIEHSYETVAGGASGEENQSQGPAAKFGSQSFVNGAHIDQGERSNPSDVFIPTVRGSPEKYNNAAGGQHNPNPTLGSFEAQPFNTDDSLSENVQLLFPTKSKTLSALNPNPQVPPEIEEEDAFEIMFLTRHFSETVAGW